MVNIQTKYSMQLTKIRRSRGRQGEIITDLAKILCCEEWLAVERRFVYYYGKSPSAPHNALPLAVMLVEALIQYIYKPISVEEEYDEMAQISIIFGRERIQQ